VSTPPIHSTERLTVLFAGGGTGGHLYPAIAIAKSLQGLNPSIRPFFVGARRGIERDVLPTTGYDHALLELHPIYRSNPLKNWRTIVGAISSWRELTRIIRREKPRLLVGTGGYAMGIAAAHARLHGLRVVQQVADSHPGITARLVAKWSKEIYLGFPEAEPLISAGSDTAVLPVGNPIEPPPSPRPDRAAARKRWNFPSSGGRVLVVFGGSQGSKAMNDALAGWISLGIPPDLYIVWATGKGTYDQFAHHESERVRVVPYLSPIAEAYAACDVALARGGAISTAELCAWGIPMILIPLPTAAADHQTSNARALEAIGAAVHVPQSELTPERMAAEVSKLLASPDRLDRMSRAAVERSRPNASREIAERILSLSARA
jgi:UDP-N-acetylglucosamine--N-acetylmuramyl-(pentapeptide) pyrophosphoryl-undecaprenol N-acetylglucosamine transferase